MSESKKIIVFNKVKFWTNFQGILFCEIKSTDNFLTLSADNLEKYEQAIYTLSQGKPVSFLIDIRDSQGNFSIDAAKLLANSPVLKKIRISEAFVVNSINTELLIISYKRIYEPNTPFGIFKNFDEALAYSLNTKKIFDGGN